MSEVSRVRIAVLVSGGGTNLQALIDAGKAGKLGKAEIALVVASNKNAYAITRARQSGIETVVIAKKDYPSPEDYDSALETAIAGHNIDFLILAGFLSILGPRVLKRYERRIINIHSSLIPSFCGKGYYGLKVHEEALAYGVKVTGATVHYVSEDVDGGEILLQKAVCVEDGDTPEILQKRVMEQAEWQILPQAAAMLSDRIADERERWQIHEKQEGTDQRI